MSGMNAVSRAPLQPQVTPASPNSPVQLKSLDDRRLVSEVPKRINAEIKPDANSGALSVPTGASTPKPTGKAKDLGLPIYSVTVRSGWVDGNNANGSGLQVSGQVTTQLDANTKLTGTVSVLGAQGNLNKRTPVEVTVIRGSVVVNHTLPGNGNTKWNVGVTAGVENDQRYGVSSTSADVAVSVGFSHPLAKGGTKVDLTGEVTGRFVFDKTNTARASARVGVKVTEGPWTVTTSLGLEARVNANGPKVGQVAQVTPVAGLEVSYKASSKVSLFSSLNYTLPTGFNGSSGQFGGTSSNVGWNGFAGVRIEL